jgi:hypothetical protein
VHLIRVASSLWVVALAWIPLEAAPIAVRFAAGETHGFLVLRGLDGTVLAHGDLLQVARNGQVKKAMVFHFKDGSVFDESVVYTQNEVYVLQAYHLVLRGPAFSDDMEATFDRATGKYSVKTKKDTHDGTLELPDDVYNGLIPTVVKDLVKGASETVHIVAFTPKPRLIELEIVPAGERKVFVGDAARSAVDYLLKPHLGILLGLFAKLLGKDPPDQHIWVLPAEVPAFLRFEGPLETAGPVWRIEQTLPVLE